MNLWTAIVLIVLAGCAVEAMRLFVKRSEKKVSSDAQQRLEQLEAKIRKQDQRIANLETILLDKQKERSFDNLKS